MNLTNTRDKSREMSVGMLSMSHGSFAAQSARGRLLFNRFLLDESDSAGKTYMVLPVDEPVR